MCASSSADAQVLERAGDTRMSGARGAENRARVARRARNAVHDYVRCYDLSRLLTFTNGSRREWESAGEALDVFMRWYVAEGRALVRQSPSVVVAERPAGGRWHIHVAIRGGYALPFREILRSWSAYMNGSGYPSALPSGTHRWHAGVVKASAYQTARYCSKYVAKALDAEREPGRHSYRVLNARRPQPRRFRCSSLAAALFRAGVCTSQCYALEFVNGETGELIPYGYLFDTGG